MEPSSYYSLDLHTRGSNFPVSPNAFLKKHPHDNSLQGNLRGTIPYA